MKTEANFLLAGAYAFELPEEVDPEPELRSALWYDGAARYVAYQPFGLVPGPGENPMLSYSFSVRRGATLVSIYRALDRPTTRVAYWKLGNGYVSTFFDDRTACEGETIDTDAGIRDIISGVTVGVRSSGLPALKITKPVFSADPADPFNRETILFSSNEAAKWLAVDVWNEPPFVPHTSRSWTQNGVARSAVTNELNLTVEVQGPPDRAPDVERYANKIAASAIPLD